MEITASMVKDLRMKTGAGLMDCKKTLVEAQGDFDRASDLLRERGIAKAASKSGRITSEGLISTFVSADYKSGAIIEISCETDFVARTDDFQSFAKALAKQVAKSGVPTDIEKLGASTFEGEGGGTVEYALKTLIGKLGENMIIRRANRLEVDGSGGIADYVHPGDKLGVLVEISASNISASDEFRVFARDIAMHVAAVNPAAVNRDDVDSAVIEKEKAIYRQQALNDGKPEAIVEKIVNGRVSKFYSEVVLMEQGFVKDPDQSVSDYVKSQPESVGSDLGVKQICRYRLGEE
ncbi:MAG: elongation factor Ts [candidate division Zixibacteria bacterium]|nr:elongation factor Ts [candidate division Zixibacteria bacterium]